VLGLTALTMVGAIGLSWYGQNNVVQGQLAHNLIGPGATLAAPAVGGATGPTVTSPVQTVTAGGGGTSAAPAAAGAGSAVYGANCAGCHGATGQGQPGIFPPLDGNPVVTGDKKTLIGIVSNGLSSKIDVKGATYTGQMPAWKGQLTNKQIADVITYIRGAWSNKGDAVTEAEVTAAAKK
jgi:mono/diheme cytochrome c family protein